MGKHPKTAKQRSIDIFDSISDSKLQVLQAAHASNFNYHWFSSETERYIKSITILVQWQFLQSLPGKYAC